MIIGKGGETIREMQNLTGCKINVSQSSGPGEVEREIGLVGSRDAINRAKQAIEEKVDAVVSLRISASALGSQCAETNRKFSDRRMPEAAVAAAAAVAMAVASIAIMTIRTVDGPLLTIAAQRGACRLLCRRRPPLTAPQILMQLVRSVFPTLSLTFLMSAECAMLIMG